MINQFLQLVYPTLCASCGVLVSPDFLFCSACMACVKPVVSLFLPITKKYSLKVIAAAAYEDPLRNVVLRKFNHDIVASRQLAQFMTGMVAQCDWDADVVIPIPLHWTRYAQRGFNQSKEMSRVIAQKMDKPVISLLMRKKKTEYQSRLSMLERQENIDDAFAVHWYYALLNKIDLKDKRVLLVDDLCTTGVTLRKAARVIARFQPKSITAFVACRAI